MSKTVRKLVLDKIAIKFGSDVVKYMIEPYMELNTREINTFYTKEIKEADQNLREARESYFSALERSKLNDEMIDLHIHSGFSRNKAIMLRYDATKSHEEMMIYYIQIFNSFANSKIINNRINDPFYKPTIIYFINLIKRHITDNCDYETYKKMMKELNSIINYGFYKSKYSFVNCKYKDGDYAYRKIYEIEQKYKLNHY
jgi:hypothetical protein